MTLTVLFDLDETLLNSHMDQFLPAYFDLLSRALSHLGSKEAITQQITQAVRKMIANQDPGKTLKEVFAEHFYPQLGTTPKACQSVLEGFYQHEYPNLKPITKPKPEASELVKWCQSLGMEMAIATNPLFPQTATRQRIEWADLDPNDFILFTSYDDFHFTKPHLAYYAEVLGRLGWPVKPTVMIGDNLSDDLFPMDTMGAETFWVNHGQNHAKWQGGTLSDVEPWIKQMTDIRWGGLNSHPEVNFAILQSTPAVMDTWLRVTADRKKHSKNHRPPENKLVEILTTVISVEEQVNIPSFNEISAGHAINGIDPGKLQKELQVRDNQQPPQEALVRFIKERKLSLAQIARFYDQKQYGRDKNLKQTMDKFVHWMAEMDRKTLHNANIL